MSTDEERIAAVRAMSPPELNVYVAMNMGDIVETQKACNKSCQARLDLMQTQVEKANKKALDAQRDIARLSGWMKAISGLVFLTIMALVTWATRK